MRLLQDNHSVIYEKFISGPLVVQTHNRSFSSVSPNMKIEHTIQRSKRDTGGIIGMSHKDAYVTTWELIKP